MTPLPEDPCIDAMLALLGALDTTSLHPMLVDQNDQFWYQHWTMQGLPVKVKAIPEENNLVLVSISMSDLRFVLNETQGIVCKSHYTQDQAVLTNLPVLEQDWQRALAEHQIGPVLQDACRHALRDALRHLLEGTRCLMQWRAVEYLHKHPPRFNRHLRAKLTRDNKAVIEPDGERKVLPLLTKRASANRQKPSLHALLRSMMVTKGMAGEYVSTNPHIGLTRFEELSVAIAPDLLSLSAHAKLRLRQEMVAHFQAAHIDIGAWF